MITVTQVKSLNFECLPEGTMIFTFFVGELKKKKKSVSGFRKIFTEHVTEEILGGWCLIEFEGDAQRSSDRQTDLTEYSCCDAAVCT